MRPTQVATLSQAIEAFLAELGRRGRTPATLRNYRADLNALIRSAGAGVKPALAATAVQRHLAVLPLAGRSRNRHTSTLRSFCEFLVAHQVLRYNPLRGVAAASVAEMQAPPAHRQIAAVLRRIDRPRDRVLVAVMLHGGLRVGEALRLRVRDVDMKRSTLVVCGPAQRKLALTPELTRTIAAYVRDACLPPESPLFATYGGRPLSYAGAHRLFRIYAGTTGLTMRSLRARAAASALEEGATLPDVALMLGHHNLASTVRYQGGSRTK